MSNAPHNRPAAAASRMPAAEALAMAEAAAAAAANGTTGGAAHQPARTVHIDQGEQGIDMPPAAAKPAADVPNAEAGPTSQAAPAAKPCGCADSPVTLEQVDQRVAALARLVVVAVVAAAVAYILAGRKAEAEGVDAGG